MNEAQKAEFRATIYGSFGPLSVIFDPQATLPSVAEHAFRTLIELLANETRTLESYHSEFSNTQILESILFIGRIIDHPCPQNRANGCTDYYTIYTAYNEIIGERLLRDGIDPDNGFVYWHTPNGKREEQHEKIGLLSLTAKQGGNKTLLSKNDLMLELKQLIFEAYNDYLQKRILFLESNIDSKSMLPYPQLDFSPAQVTCPITSQVFHTPVILINVNNERSGPIEKEKAVALLESSEPCCPITRKPIRGFVVCTATKAQADQFWEKYQTGRYTQEFVRFIPNPAAITKPDCCFLSDRDQHNNRVESISTNRTQLLTNSFGYSFRGLLARDFLQTFGFEPDETSPSSLTSDQATLERAVNDQVVAYRNFLSTLAQPERTTLDQIESAVHEIPHQPEELLRSIDQPLQETIFNQVRDQRQARNISSLRTFFNQPQARGLTFFNQPIPRNISSSAPAPEIVARFMVLALSTLYASSTLIFIIASLIQNARSSRFESQRNQEHHQFNNDDTDDSEDLYAP